MMPIAYYVAWIGVGTAAIANIVLVFCSWKEHKLWKKEALRMIEEAEKYTETYIKLRKKYPEDFKMEKK